MSKRFQSETLKQMHDRLEQVKVRKGQMCKRYEPTKTGEAK